MHVLDRYRLLPRLGPFRKPFAKGMVSTTLVTYAMHGLFKWSVKVLTDTQWMY